jgi:glycosyltransferase involved in cell wall biosynthesis
MTADEFVAQKRIRAYVDAEVRREQEELARCEVEPGACARVTQAMIQRLREFYWTLTRLSGLGHLHDGSTAHEQEFRRRCGKLADYVSAQQEITGAERTPKLLVDMWNNLACDQSAGIPRVVQEIANTALRRGGIPVLIFGDKIFRYDHSRADMAPVDVQPGDTLLIAGVWWAYPEQTLGIVEKTRAEGGLVVFMAHDLVPLEYPHFCKPEVACNFVGWFDKVVLRSDAVVCVSHAVASELLDHVALKKPSFTPHLKLGWRHHGADFAPAETSCSVAPQDPLGDESESLFLSVGTLEPRKGYSIALDALDMLWSEGASLRYLIVGRRGWSCAALERRIREHPEYGRRLFWLDDVGDAALRALYLRAHCLVFPSVSEGFGLPLVEAAHYGLPAIASDIPVFHEIAGDAVRYFDVAAPASLAARLREALASPRVAPRIEVSTWRAATESLLDMIAEGSYQLGELGPQVARRAAGRARSDA